MVRTLDKQGFEEALQTRGKLVVVDFATDWCPYCKRLAPIIEEISDEHSNEIEVYYVDTDDQPDISDRYDIMTVPTVYVFTDGEIKGHAVNPRTKDAVLDLIFKK